MPCYSLVSVSIILQYNHDNSYVTVYVNCPFCNMDPVYVLSHTQV